LFQNPPGNHSKFPDFFKGEDMRRVEVCLIALFFVAPLLPKTLMAQDTTPPRLNRSVLHSAYGEDTTIEFANSSVLHSVSEENTTIPTFQAEFTVDEGMLELQDITRSQFLDRLSQSLFPGEIINLVLIYDNVSAPLSFSQQNDQDVKILIMVKETLYYITPRHAVTSEDLDALDQIGLTNGMIFVKITFC
jgi:hypothetical protein